MNISLEDIKIKAIEVVDIISQWSTSPKFYMQLGSILIAIFIAFVIARFLKKRLPLFNNEPLPDEGMYTFRKFCYDTRDLVFPLFSVFLLTVAIEVCLSTVGQSWMVRIAESMAVIFLLFSVIKRFIKDPFINALFRWVGIPVAILHVLGWLDNVILFLDSIKLTIGNINITAYVLSRTVIFGTVLFWLGRISNTAGQNVIRKQQGLDSGTREVFAKLFQIVLFIVLFLLLLQIVGINLTALAVFGGALGVGLGFGLQQIASNFVSGIIILLDRSLTVGDYIELEDGRSGYLRELNMRSATLETFDGKDIMVPNEQFITTTFINWTHKNKKQRYSIEFQVAYSTDLHALFDLLRNVVASHPAVLSGDDTPIEEKPDAEIAGFGDSGVDILIEFWMDGIDDGPNRVGADLLQMIWDAFKEHNIEIPFPQREVKILNQGS